MSEIWNGGVAANWFSLNPQDLNVESGLNDGVGVPLPVILLTVA
jgi:hypothetical protein